MQEIFDFISSLLASVFFNTWTGIFNFVVIQSPLLVVLVCVPLLFLVVRIIRSIFS